MTLLSWTCSKDLSKVLFLVWLLIRLTPCCCHSKFMLVTHIKSEQRLRWFDDLLILAAEHAGQNVSAVFWLCYCHTMPPHSNVMGGQVWPQWKRFSCHVSHFHCKGNICVCVHSLCACVCVLKLEKGISTSWKKLHHMELLLPHSCTTPKTSITSSLGISTMLLWEPGGDPVIISHCLTFLSMAVYISDVLASTSYSASCINGWGLLQRKWNKYIHIYPAETVTCLHKVNLINLCLCAAVSSGLCLKTMAPTITLK